MSGGRTTNNLIDTNCYMIRKDVISTYYRISNYFERSGDDMQRPLLSSAKPVRPGREGTLRNVNKLWIDWR
jgi:hypothetical protein